MRSLPRPLLLLPLLLLAGALAAWLWHRHEGLPAYEPPSVRHPPPPADGEIRLVALGDWGSARRAQAEVARAMDRVAAAVGGLHGGLFLGDNFYPQGVQDVDDPQFTTTFAEVYDTAWLGLLPWYPVLGNHDYDGNAAAQLAYTARSSGRWRLPHEYYRVDLPDAEHPIVTLLALDTNKKFPRWDEETAWLEAELASLVGAPQWVVAYGHNPTASYVRKEARVEPQMAARIVPLLRRYPVVTLYLAGHSHAMELIEQDGPTLVVCGAGGKDLYEIGTGPGLEFAACEHGFVLLRASAERLALEFRDREARLLHAWERTRAPAPGG